MAQHTLGYMCNNGQGVPQDYRQAAKLFRLAADQGHADAQGRLGAMYYQGRGIYQDYHQAAKWYRSAANQGHALAQYNLGLLYFYGEGVLRNDVKAQKWFNLSAAQGDKEAIKRRDLQAQRITASELKKAQALAAEFKLKKEKP